MDYRVTRNFIYEGCEKNVKDILKKVPQQKGEKIEALGLAVPAKSQGSPPKLPQPSDNLPPENGSANNGK